MKVRYIKYRKIIFKTQVLDKLYGNICQIAILLFFFVIFFKIAILYDVADSPGTQKIVFNTWDISTIEEISAFFVHKGNQIQPQGFCLFVKITYRGVDQIIKRLTVVHNFFKYQDLKTSRKLSTTVNHPLDNRPKFPYNILQYKNFSPQTCKVEVNSELFNLKSKVKHNQYLPALFSLYNYIEVIVIIIVLGTIY
eukprot:TRINITY_DN8027_c0_g2_i1.p1 TRINITY_DN8027_c0_g2~~TRINITY_DN8027_c0_g2_i1.p1  ORF type:complete len:195 (+),score=-3.90 TRINITY_DN8027_c0_g2_i1:169-753(+)